MVFVLQIKWMFRLILLLKRRSLWVMFTTSYLYELHHDQLLPWRLAWTAVDWRHAGHLGSEVNFVFYSSTDLFRSLPSELM